MVDVLMNKIAKVEDILGDGFSGARIQGSVSNEAFVPLGQQRQGEYKDGQVIKRTWVARKKPEHAGNS